MEGIYKKIRERARQMVADSPTPEFYIKYSQADKESNQFFQSDPTIIKLREFVAKETENDFGHGLDHVTKVSIDAGTLIIVECRKLNFPEDRIKRKLMIVQCAGLLHDIKRKQKEHAVRGAEFAEIFLNSYPFTDAEIEEICQAIRNHEAFKEVCGVYTPEGILTSDCLYDADKFRWGPDNFSHTVWDMVTFSKIPFHKFVRHYPSGITALKKIRTTFRSETGKKYGPQFINIGISVGEKLYKVINREFSQYTSVK